MNELTVAVLADERAPDIELDEARQRIRLRRPSALPKSSFKKRTRRQSQQQPARLPKRQRTATTRSELRTVYEMAPPGVRGGIQVLDA